MAPRKIKHLEDLKRISAEERQTLSKLCDEVVSETAKGSGGAINVIVNDRPHYKVRIAANITTESEWAKVVIHLSKTLSKHLDEIEHFSPKLTELDRANVLRALDRFSAKIRKAKARLTNVQLNLWNDD